MNNLSIGSLLKRFTSPTPAFWKAVQTAALKWTAIASALVVATETGQIHMSGWLLTGLKISALIFGSNAALAQFAAEVSPVTPPADDTANS